MAATDGAKNAILAGGALMSIAGTPAVAAVQQSSLDTPLKDAATSMITAATEAGEEAAAGIRSADEAVGDGPIYESEYAEHAPPVDSADVAALMDTWTDADADMIVSDDAGLSDDDLADVDDPGLSDDDLADVDDPGLSGL